MIERIELTTEQRNAIRQRDDNHCQYPADHVCSGNRLGAVHHITPLSWALNVLNWTEQQVNIPENLLYICQHSHDNLIHNDIAFAKSNYKYDPNAFEEIFKFRKIRIDDKEPYWNAENMYEMAIIAQYRTLIAKRQGFEWPLRTNK
ncbi:MAG: hypothetical protein ACREQ5_39340 [Candidatus Dormibacteria bacterium]